MQKVIVFLGLKPEATEEQIIQAIKDGLSLKDETISTLEQLNEELSKSLEEVAVFLGLKPKDSGQQIVQAIKDELTAKDKLIEGLSQTIEGLTESTEEENEPLKDGIKALSEKDLKKKAQEVLKKYSERPSVHLTSDGTPFFSKDWALLHKKCIGGTVYTFNRE